MRSLTVATHGAEPLHLEGVGESLPGYNRTEPVLSLATYLCFEIKVLLNAEGISKALLCNLFITAIALQREALRARKTNHCFWRKGNAKL